MALMRGDDRRPDAMFSYVSAEQRVPADHPLRAIRTLVDDVLRETPAEFDGLYARRATVDSPREPITQSRGVASSQSSWEGGSIWRCEVKSQPSVPQGITDKISQMDVAEIKEHDPDVRQMLPQSVDVHRASHELGLSPVHRARSGSPYSDRHVSEGADDSGSGSHRESMVFHSLSRVGLHPVDR